VHDRGAGGLAGRVAPHAGQKGDAVKLRTLALAMVFAAPLAATAVAGPVWAQSEDERQANPSDGTHFKCQEGADLVAKFDTRGARLVAIVDAGEGAHALPIRPWTGGPAVLTWTDGQRTLTWSPGVQIMWMDGGTHRMCGRAGHHH
jgi:hypothetical protein